MRRPEELFDQDMTEGFDEAFPKDKIRTFEQIKKRDRRHDWVNIFDALEYFGLPGVEPERRGLVVALLSMHPYGPQIITRDTESGVQAYRRDITPLLKAAHDVVKKDSSGLPPQTPSSAERDWSRTS